MKLRFVLIQLCFFTLLAQNLFAQQQTGIDLSADAEIQTLERLDAFIFQNFPSLEKSFEPGASIGQWRFVEEERKIIIMADRAHNRVRIMTPIQTVTSEDHSLLYAALEANFAKALDTRYAITRNILWSVYLSPLDMLSFDGFLAGMQQVIVLAENTGSSFGAVPVPSIEEMN